MAASVVVMAASVVVMVEVEVASEDGEEVGFEAFEVYR
jgi:hypothetical protein